MIIHNPILTGSFTVNGTDVASITSSAASIASLNSYTASLNAKSSSFATTGSNTFVGNQVVSGSLTVTGSITTPGTLTAQTLVVQTITSSVDFVTGSTKFGSLSSNTHQFTGSVGITGSLTGISATFNGDLTIDTNTLYVDSTNNRVGIGTITPTAGKFQINESATQTVVHFQNNDATTTLANSFITNFRNSNDGNGRYSLSSWQVQNGIGNDQIGFIGVQSVTGAGNYTPNLIFGLKTGASTYSTYFTISSTGAATFSSSVTANSFYANAGNELRFYRPANDYYWRINSDSSNFLRFGTYLANGTDYGTNPKILLHDNGNVGIGTTSPDNKLSVRNEGTGGIAVIDVRGGASGGAGAVAISGNGTVIGTTSFDLIQNSAGAYVYQRDNNPLIFGTNNTERMRITSGGNVGIGTTSPTSISSFNRILHIDGGSVNSAICLSGNSLAGQANIGYDNSVLYIDAIGAATAANNTITFNTTDVNSSSTRKERMRITSGGNVLINTTSNNGLRLGEKLNVSTLNDYGGIAITTYAGSSAGRSSIIDLNKSRGTSDGSMTAVANGDEIGYLIFRGSDGTNFVDGAYIRAEVEGTVSANSVPMLLKFHTGPSGTTERMRIFSNGNVAIQDTFVDNGSKLNITSGAKGGIRIVTNATYDAISIGGTGAFKIDAPGVGAGRFEINDSGTAFLRQYSNGTLSISSGQVVSSSDKDLKIDDGGIEFALSKILQLNPRYFYWKDSSGIESKDRQLGFYAQDVKDALGEEVANENENGKWGIYDRGIIAMLTKAIQELNEKIKILENK